MVKKNRTTITDVARHLGIHKTTVSRALNNPNRISRELSQKIAQAVKELNYIPNRAAQSLSLINTKTIALLLPSFSNDVFDDVIAGVKQETDRGGYSLMIGDATYSELGEESIVETYIQHAVDGFIMTSTRHTERTVTLLRETGVPVAEIMNLSDAVFDFNYGVDQEAAAVAMTRYLLDKGKRRIAFCSLVLDWRAGLRKKGWEKTLRVAGLGTHRCLHSRAASSFQAGAELLVEALQKWRDMDAIFFVSDELAAGAVMECHRRGLKPGQDIAICGFNDLPYAKSIYPALTTVLTPRREMGRLAAQSLISLSEGRAVEEPVKVLPFEVIVRETA